MRAKIPARSGFLFFARGQRLQPRDTESRYALAQGSNTKIWKGGGRDVSRRLAAPAWAFLWAAKGVLLGLASISGECEVVHTSLPIPPSKVAIATCGPLPRGEQMAQERDSLGFRFAVVVALAVIIVATTTWAADHERASAGSIPPSEVIYRAPHLNLF